MNPGSYQNLDYVLAVLESEEDLVLPAHLVADLLDALQGHFAIPVLIVGLEDVAWVSNAVYRSSRSR